MRFRREEIVTRSLLFRVFVAALACSADFVGAEKSPLAPLAHTIREAADVQRAVDTVSRVYSTDRWFTFPKFEETATYLKSRLQESGLTEAEIDGPADGHTQAGFWTMPLAWDVKTARLEVTSPEKMMLCDYEKVPTCLGMWSGPTPPGGIDAELVDLRNAVGSSQGKNRTYRQESGITEVRTREVQGSGGREWIYRKS